jgi:predicted  nucleic acid-binding Zn-ribbon protein
MIRSAPLYALQKVDSEILARRERLATIDAQLGETDELIALRDRLTEIRDSMRTWRARQRDEELQLQGVQQKKRASEQRLYGGKVRNPKELSDLQAEVKSLTRRQEVIEESVFEAMVMIEELEATESQVARDLQRVDRKWKADQAELCAEQEAQAGRLAELMAERQARADAIPAPDLNTYEHLRDRKGGLAVAELRGAECQGCMTAVSASRVKEARSYSLAFCGTCGRILYPTN